MSRLYRFLLTFLTCFSLAIAVATPIHAQATITPIVLTDTRVECTTGADGKQVCHSVIVERISSDSAKTTVSNTKTASSSSQSTTSAQLQHTIVNTGIQENLIIALFGMFVFSCLGYSYSKTRV